MTKATPRRALEPAVTFLLTLALSSVLPLAGLGQETQPAEDESVADQITELVADAQDRVDDAVSTPQRTGPTTSTLPDPVRPRNCGRYISATVAAGWLKTPGETARTR